MADDNNSPDDERGKKHKRDALIKAWAQNPRFKVHKPRGRGFIVGGQSPSANATVIGAPVVKGNCWICESAIADSGEHKSKKSDLKAVFGDVSPQRPIYFHQGESRNRRVQSLDASRLKWTKVICGYCNSARTQPHDMAWDTLHAGLRKRVPSLKPGDRVGGNSIFADAHDTARAMVNVHLYFAKASGLHAGQGEDAPLNIAPFAKAIYDGNTTPRFLSPFWNNDEAVDTASIQMSPIFIFPVPGAQFMRLGSTMLMAL